MGAFIRFLRDYTLPVAIAVGTTAYLLFYHLPQLDALGNQLSGVFDFLLPVSVFFTLLFTFCKIDFHQMRPHRWHVGILVAQLLLAALNVAVILWLKACNLLGDGTPLTPHSTLSSALASPLFWEALLTCVIGPSASAAPVVVGKLGGNISTMTTYTLLSAVASAMLIPLVFPILERTMQVGFVAAFLIILHKVALILLLPLLLGWLVQHWMPTVARQLAAMPNLSFYCWAVSLSITTGITVKNIVHSDASVALLLCIAAGTLLLCFVQFVIGRAVGRRLGEEVNAGQALFQKNTALSIWVAYIYLHPVASVGAGCYVLWQNIVNSVELWRYSSCHKVD